MRTIRATRVQLLAAGTITVVTLLGAAALPVLGQDPSPSAEPAAGAPTEKPGKGPKESHAPEVDVTLQGTVSATTDAAGETTYTLSSGGTTYTLSAGPPWFWGDKNPLKGAVGKSVTIVGEQEQGTTEVDVRSIDGTAIRGEGRPPWAGGWKVVGKVHPGWAQWKVDKEAAKAQQGHGRPSWAGPKDEEPSESAQP